MENARKLDQNHNKNKRRVALGQNGLIDLESLNFDISGIADVWNYLATAFCH